MTGVQTCALPIFLGTALPDLVTWLQKWIYDLARVRTGAGPRYHPGAAEQLAAVARQTDPIRLTRLARRIADARAIASHPVNPKLFVEDLLMQYRSLLTQYRKMSGTADGG